LKKGYVLATVGILAAIYIAVIVFGSEITPAILEPNPTAIQPISSHPNSYQPEIIPISTYTPGPIQTATSVPTNTPIPIPTSTLIVIPTLVSNSLLPDLTVTGISDPICVPDRIGTILEFTIYVRNIGRARTRTFGSFDVGVFFILGQRRYSLDEWATQFEGVIGSSITEVFNLNPNDDIKFTVVIDLKGNKKFGIEVIANSGASPIRETDMTNNTLIKYFSGYCY